MRRLLGHLELAISSPLESLNSWQRAARWVYDFARLGWRQLSEDDAPSLAAALSFRVIFGLLPVLVLVTIMAKAFFEPRSSELVQRIVELIGPVGVEISGFGADGQAMNLQQFLEMLIDKAADFRLAALGWVGGVILIYSAIALMVTIENAFNRVVRAPSGRPWVRRVPLYWFVLTVGPILLGVTPYLNAKYMEAVESIAVWQWLFVAAKFIWNFGIIWLFMAALYLWVPNASMKWKAVLIGALVSAVLLEIGKRFLGAYVGTMIGRNPLLASLGLVPFFMFWVYAMWMVVLFGLEVASMIQHLGGRRMEELERSRPHGELVDSTSVLTVMQAAAMRFQSGEPVTPSQLSESTGLSRPAVEAMVERLVQRGCLHRIEDHPDAVALARPAEAITAEELMKIGWELTSRASPDSRVAGVIERLRDAQSAVASGTTLGSLTARPG
jgi:membrane protein